MQPARSNESVVNMGAEPRIWKLFFYSIVPVVLAVIVGLWLAGRIHRDIEAQTQNQRTEEVVAQDRLLVDALWTTIETIKAHALSLEKIREEQVHSAVARPAALPDGVILHWAVFGVKDGRIAEIKQVARNPRFPLRESFESWYLSTAQSHINLHELEENGVSVLRVKREAGASSEWLAFAFSGSIAPDPTLTKSAPVILALVDPAEAFPVFRRWTSRSEGGNLRGYLVGSDGFVIAHSQHPYVASDFSATQVFAQGVRPMMQGAVRSGAGVFKAIDHVSVTVAYARPGTLPLGAVVERVNPQVEARTQLAALGAWIEESPRDPFIAALCVALLALGMAVGSDAMIRKRVSEAFARARDLAKSESVVAPAVASSGAILEAWAQEEEISEIVTELPEEASAQAHFEGDGREHVEHALEHELLSEPASEPEAQTHRSERILVAQFETETQNARDPKVVAKTLAETTARLAGAPALFFAYRDSMGACLLQAHAGMPVGTMMSEPLSFRLSDVMRARIARYKKNGKTASLADDPDLGLLLAKRFGGTRYEAWPVTGPEGQLLGVLAVLGGTQVHPDTDGLSQVMKMSAQKFEHLRSPGDRRRDFPRGSQDV